MFAIVWPSDNASDFVQSGRNVIKRGLAGAPGEAVMIYNTFILVPTVYFLDS